MRTAFSLLLVLISLLPFAVAANEPAPADADRDYAAAVQLLIDGRLDEARAALEQIAVQSPEHAGAWLDLAILQCNLGHAEEAAALFDAIELRFAPPPAIRQVIAQYRAQGCKPALAAIRARFRLGRGSDSNANQGALNPNFSIGSGSSQINLVLAPEFTPKHDTFTTASAELTMPAPLFDGQFLAQFQSRKYDHQSRYDLQTLALGADHPWRGGAWEFDAMGLYSLAILGSRPYQERYQALLSVIPPLTLPTGWQLGATAAATRFSYPTLNGYDSLQYEGSGWLSYSNDGMLLRLGLGYTADQAQGKRAGGDRSGLFASANGRLRIHDGIFADFDWVQQRWNDARIYSPALIQLRRKQQTDLLRLGLYLPVTAQQGVYLEYRDTRNTENISLFEYRAHLFQVSWQWNFTH